VIEGDQETALDGGRISAAGSGFHLDAALVARAKPTQSTVVAHRRC